MSDSSSSYDVIVIGGGVTGSGTARDLAMRGLKTLLLEKKDFAGGTTGICSGMIHGGLRYLQFDINTTKNSCIDSGYIQKLAPHLLFRIPFLVTVMREDKLGLEIMETVMETYERFSPAKQGKPHTRLSRDEALKLEPGLNPHITGAVTMDEWGIDVFRLCLINALSAQEHGAEVKNHCRVESLIREGDVIKGVVAKDLLTGLTERYYARLTVNAAGPWVPDVCKMAGVEVKLRPGKGTHIIFDRRLTNYAVTMETIDGRQIFLMPHENGSILGCTDDDFYGDMNYITGNDQELQYLLEAGERIIPSIRNYRIVRVMAGVRVTLWEWRKNEDKLSREHKNYDHAELDGLQGFITVAGGKLATYRIMAQEISDIACRHLGNTAECKTHVEPLPGGEAELSIEEIAKEFKVPFLLARRLYFRHGARTPRVLALLKENRNWDWPVCTCDPVSEAEIRYVIRHELARTLDDVRRRTHLGTGPCQGMGCAWPAGIILGEELGFSAEETLVAVADFLQERWKGKAPILPLSPLQLAQEELNRWKYHR